MIGTFNAFWPNQHAGLHSTRNEPLRVALDTLPGYTDGVVNLRRLADAIEELDASPLALGVIRQTMTDRVLEVVAKGPVKVEQLVKAARSIEQDDRAASETRAALIDAGRAIMNLLDTTVDSAADRLLCNLNAELQRLMTEIDGDLFTGSAEDAISTGDAAVYQQAHAWGERYKQLRAAQRIVMTEMGPVDRITDVLLPVLTMANILTVFPDYGAWAAGVPVRDQEGNPLPARAPFPPLAWDADQRPQLAWLARHPDAGPWIPTIAEFTAVQDQLTEARHAAARGETNHRTNQTLYAEYGPAPLVVRKVRT